jgi:hypothetical protein
VLQRFRLPDFRGSGGPRFVTPTLIHGGIPDYCLDDFFERLVWPAVTGKLDYSGSVDDLLVEWRERPSLALFTDKPVRRFLEQGGKVAADFLQRCLDMALQAYETGQLPSAKDLGLPDRVVERFNTWLQQKDAFKSPSKAGLHADFSRYRAPEVLLNATVGCLLLSFPSQRLIRSKLDSTQIKLEVQRVQLDDTLSTTLLLLRGTAKGEWIETEPCDLDLGLPDKRYEVTLLSGEKRLRQWAFSGIGPDQPWMIFHSRSGRLLPGRTITERDFWILFSAPWELSTTTQAVVEATTLAQGYQAEHFGSAEGISQDIRLTHPDGRSFSIPIEQRSIPTLSSASPLVWPRVSSGDFEVYSGTLPALLIPLPVDAHGPAIPDSLHLTIAPIGESWPGERREIPLKNLVQALNLQDRCLTLSLNDPQFLGPTPCGRFIIQVRGRLGEDAIFRLCTLPQIEFHFPREALLPDSKTGLQDLSLTLESPHLRELTVDSPAELVLQDSTSPGTVESYRVTVPAGSEQVVLHSRFSVGGKTIEIPLEVAIPRLRWTVSGLSETGSLYWHDMPIKISLQELEEAPEARLLIRGDFGQDTACALVLQGADHQGRFELKNGKAGCLLSPFLDSLRESSLPRNNFYLEFSLPEEDSLRHLYPLQVETRWITENLQAVQELTPDEGKRVVLFRWHDKGKVKNRALRLWSLSSHPKEPIEVAVEDGRSEAEIERSLTDFPHGLYRLELFVLDPWAGSFPATPPGPFESNVLDLEVREDGITLLDSPARHIETLLENIATGLTISDLPLDPQTLHVFASQPEQAGRFCRALYAREEKQGDSLVVLRQALQLCGEEQDAFAESLAAFLTEEGRLGIENTTRLLARLFVALGFLGRPWGPRLKHFLLSRRDPDLPEDGEDLLLQVQGEIAALYGQATWQSLASAKQFLQHLHSVSGELIYQDQTLLKLEGIVTLYGEELLRWWCGEKKEKRRTIPSWVHVPLKEIVKISPRSLRPVGTLCLTATLQRAGAYDVLHLSEHAGERVNFWGNFFYRTRGHEYRRELRWAEETLCR